MGDTFGEPKSFQGGKGAFLPCNEVYWKLPTLKITIKWNISSINLEIMGLLDIIPFPSALLRVSKQVLEHARLCSIPRLRNY